MNVAPVMVAGSIIRLIQRRFLIGSSRAVALLGHVASCTIFSFACYWLTIVLLGAWRTRNFEAFTVAPFLGPAAAWQLMNSILIYVTIALLTHLQAMQEQDREAPQSQAAVEKTQLFVRRDDEIRPLDPERIILIRGAGDYAEIVTDVGVHLVRATLSRLAQQLGQSFLRVHRSQLVNGRRVSWAEPAGSGRLLLHMANGDVIQTSRAGAQILRERLI
jgi:DNA-binding LytR/AlgR family response regulator